MKIGQRIVYVDTRGKEHGATVTAVPGTGDSGFKILHLEYGEKKTPVEHVSHGRDRVSGQGYWLLDSDVKQAPERRAPVEEQPIALAKAEESLGLPGADRRLDREGLTPKPKRKRTAAT